MSKYYVVEGKPDGEFNASSKARNDVEKILEKNKIKKLYVNTIKGIEKKKIKKVKQYISYIKNKKKWNESLKSLKKGDIVFIQYPLLNTTIGFAKVLQKYKKLGVIFVSIIHDMDSLRYKPEIQGKLLYNRVCHDDKYILNNMTYIIAHNTSMKNELVKLRNDSNKIIELKLFDYLLETDYNKIDRVKQNIVIIAGNLSLSKSKFLSQLKNINVNFNLYGVGFDENIKSKNINYCGSFTPEELVKHMVGSYGLVWDGISIDTCTGGFGEYLKYNNPHKASLYLTAGIPIIVWKQSAIANFVEKNNVGLVVDSLKELNKKMSNVTDEEYMKMTQNARKISKKLSKGEFLSKAIKQIK